MSSRRSFIRGLVRVAPLVIVPAEGLEVLGRAMVGWTRAAESERLLDRLAQDTFLYTGAMGGGKTNAFIAYLEHAMPQLAGKMTAERDRMLFGTPSSFRKTWTEEEFRARTVGTFPIERPDSSIGALDL